MPFNQDHSNLEDEWILWVGLKIDESNPAHAYLFSRTYQHKYFDEESQCESYILNHISKDDRIDLIFNMNKNYPAVLSRIHDLRHVSCIYILCSRDTSYKEYPKVSKLFDSYKNI